MKEKCKSTVDTIDNFLIDSMSKLSIRPQSVEEITESKKVLIIIQEEMNKMYEKYTIIENLNKLIRLISGQGLNITSFLSRWENLEEAVKGFDNLIEEQKDLIKDQITQKTKNINNDTDKFLAKWNALKPKEKQFEDISTVRDISLKIKDWLIE